MLQENIFLDAQAEAVSLRGAINGVHLSLSGLLSVNDPKKALYSRHAWRPQSVFRALSRRNEAVTA